MLWENGHTVCVLKIIQSGHIDFQKPISCHLYPIRVRLTVLLKTLLHRWRICAVAYDVGKEGVLLLDFLKSPDKEVWSAVVQQINVEMWL